MKPADTKRLPHRSQGGFSMVEMLLAAFIMAVGIMGLSMLQIMAMKTARGGRSLSTAINVANRVMDQIEMEGRLTWLNVANSQMAAPAALPNLQFVDKDALAKPLIFNVNGREVNALSPDPAERTPFFTVNVTRVANVAQTTGQMGDFLVAVTFSDTLNASTKQPIIRSVNLTRRILHG